MQLQKVLIKDIMIPEPYTIDVHEDFAVAWDIFRLRKIRHLPILINDRLLTGILTLSDLYRTISPKKTRTGTLIYDVKQLNSFKLEEVMTSKVYTLSPEDYMGKAIDLMVEHSCGCLPIVNETNYLEGIVTRGQVMKVAAKHFA